MWDTLKYLKRNLEFHKLPFKKNRELLIKFLSKGVLRKGKKVNSTNETSRKLA